MSVDKINLKGLTVLELQQLGAKIQAEMQVRLVQASEQRFSDPPGPLSVKKDEKVSEALQRFREKEE